MHYTSITYKVLSAYPSSLLVVLKEIGCERSRNANVDASGSKMYSSHPIALSTPSHVQTTERTLHGTGRGVKRVGDHLVVALENSVPGLTYTSAWV